MLEKLQGKTSKMRSGLLNPNSAQPMPDEPWNPNGSGVDMGPIGKTMGRAGMGALMVTTLSACESPISSSTTPTPEAQRTESPHTGAVFEINDFTDYYKTTTDTKIRSMMVELEATHGTFEESWAISSMEGQESQNSVQLFGFQNAHMVGFWTEVNGKPVMQNAQNVHGRYTFDNAKNVLTYELMVDGTEASLSQTFLKLSIESNSLTSLDSLVTRANSGDSSAQSQLTELLSKSTGNFTISLTNLATGRTDIGTMSSDMVTEVSPTATPTQPSLLDRIMEMVGVIPVYALEPPLIEIEGITIKDPVVSNPELFDILDTQSPISKFVNAFIVKQDGETENAFQTRRQTFINETISGLQPTVFTIDGKQYVILATQDISSTQTVNEANIPIIIAEKNDSNEWVWSNTSLKQMCDLNGLKCGSTISGDENYQDPAYNALIQNEFSIVNSGGTSPQSVSRDGLRFEHNSSLFAQQNGLSFRPGHLFDWGDDNPADLNTATKAQITEWMNKWVYDIVNGHPFFDSINFANEPVGIYDGSQYWVAESNPWYRAYQEQWPIEAYSMIYNELEARNLKPGEDVHLILNLPYGANEWGYNPQFTIDFMALMKKQIQAKVGPDAVMDIGIQFHLRDVPQSQVDWGGPNIADLDEEKLTQFFQDLGEIGPVHITELSTKNVEDQKTAMEGINLVFSAAIRSGVVKDVVFWEALKTDDFLFDAQLQNNPDYYLLLQTLFSNLQH